MKQTLKPHWPVRTKILITGKLTATGVPNSFGPAVCQRGLLLCAGFGALQCRVALLLSTVKE